MASQMLRVERCYCQAAATVNSYACMHSTQTFHHCAAVYSTQAGTIQKAAKAPSVHHYVLLPHGNSRHPCEPHNRRTRAASQLLLHSHSQRTCVRVGHVTRGVSNRFVLLVGDGAWEWTARTLGAGLVCSSVHGAEANSAPARPTTPDDKAR